MNVGGATRQPGLPIRAFYRAAARAPGAIAIAGPGDSVTYGDLVDQVDALASALQFTDPVPGSRVGICAGNTREHLLALLATYAAGKTWVPLNPRNGRVELDAMIAATRPGLLVVDASYLDRCATSPAPVIISNPVTEPDGPATVRGLIARWIGTRPAPIARSDEDPQIIKFSGGSTGGPKPVVQPVRCLEAQARGLREFFDLDGADVNLIAAPLTHGASCFVLPILAVGGTHVLIEDPKPAAILDVLESYGVTTLYAPPTMIYGLLDAARLVSRSFPRLKHLIYSAAPMTPERIRQAQRTFGPVVETAYGQVEAPQIVTAMRASELMLDQNLSSIGRATPEANVAIMSHAGDLLGPDAMGEIVVQGPLVMSGYLDRSEQTSRTIVNGWLHTGDLGVTDRRGYFYIRGRLHDVINTGGFKVFPGDVEAALSRHPSVAECCVFGVEDDKWGEAVHAAVVLTPGTTASPAQLIAHVKAVLDSVKAPKQIFFVDELPRNPAGKVSRADVRRVANLTPR